MRSASDENEGCQDINPSVVAENISMIEPEMQDDLKEPEEIIWQNGLVKDIEE